MKMSEITEHVADTIKKDFRVLTFKTGDKILPFATFVKHENYNHGLWIAVCWSQKEEIAIKKHDEWVERLKQGVDFIMDMETGKIYHKEIENVG